MESRRIIDLNSVFVQNWEIRARVVQKAHIRVFGNGKRFSMHLEDVSGKIRAVAFNEACDYFYGRLEVRLNIQNNSSYIQETPLTVSFYSLTRSIPFRTLVCNIRIKMHLGEIYGRTCRTTSKFISKWIQQLLKLKIAMKFQELNSISFHFLIFVLNKRTISLIIISNIK